MRRSIIRLVHTLLALSTSSLVAQLPGIDFDDLAHQGAEPTSVVYKSTPEGDLTVDIYQPEGEGPHPALIFVHGGGWTAGTNKNHHEHSRYFAARGMVVFNLSYRLIPSSGDGIDLFDQIGDIRSAVRWVRSHALNYEIDPGRIALAGESAGGHLAACVAFIDAFDAAGEDTTLSAKPDLAILLNPITDLPRIPWYSGHTARVGETPLPIADTPIDDPLDPAIHPARRLSPLFYARHPDQPPALFVHGEADTVVPFAQSESLHKALVAADQESELLALPRTDHAFVIPGWGPSEAINRTLRAMDAFLVKQGFLKGLAALLPLDINHVKNGNLETDLSDWSMVGAMHISGSGATSDSLGYLRGADDSALSLTQTLTLTDLQIDPNVVSSQLLTFRIRAWIRVSELSHYDSFEVAARCLDTDGSVLSKHILTWETPTTGNWTNATHEALLPEGTASVEITVETAIPLPLEIDELSLTLSSTTRAIRFSAWQAHYFSDEEIEGGSIAEPDAVISDGSSLRNIEKYALSLPRIVSVNTMVTAVERDGHLALRFPYDSKKTDIGHRVHFASDLDLPNGVIVSPTAETPFLSSARGMTTVVDPEQSSTRFGQVFIAPK